MLFDGELLGSTSIHRSVDFSCGNSKKLRSTVSGIARLGFSINLLGDTTESAIFARFDTVPVSSSVELSRLRFIGVDWAKEHSDRRFCAFVKRSGPWHFATF